MQITCYRSNFLFRDINKSEMPDGNKEFIKSRLKDSAYTSFRSYNYKSEINLTNGIK